MTRFASPECLLLLLLVPLIGAVAYRKQRGTALLFSSLSILKQMHRPRLFIARYGLPTMRCLALTGCVLALARPQSGKEETRIYTEGIDIVLCIDVSSSMRALDFELNGKPHDRLFAVKHVIKNFIKRRKDDRIGVVVFARYPYTQCPLTTDYGVLLQLLDSVEIGMIEDGTAIGSALASAVNRLKNSKAKSRVIILLTDGRNNCGKIDPLTAAELAKALGIKVYTVGAGSDAPYIPYPVQTPFGVQIIRQPQIEIDEQTLREIAKIAGGKYYRATDTAGLDKTYQEIDRMEKTREEVHKYREYKELFPYFLVPALGLLLVEILLANSRFQKLP